MDLVERVLSEFKSVRRRATATFACICVTVDQDDGMSWSAELVRTRAAERHPDWNQWCLTQGATEYGLPEIARIVGLRPFLRRAVAHRLASPFFTMSPWADLGILLLAAVLEALVKVFEHSGLALKDFFLFAAMAGTGMLAKSATTYLKTRPQSKCASEVKKALDGEISDKILNDLVEDLARDLRRREFPRLVIMDGYERLDSLTRQTIERYLTRYRETALGSEVWVVFEGADGGGDTLSARATLHRAHFAYRRIEFYRQCLLDVPTRRRLARDLGKGDEVLEFKTVGAIRRGAGSADKLLGTVFKDHRAHHPRPDGDYEALDFLSFIAANAHRGSLTLEDEFLLRKLTDTSVMRTQLLKHVLPGAQCTYWEFDKRFGEVREYFQSPSIVESGPRRLRVTPTAACILEDLTDALGLPSPGLIHLYWALFWNDKWSPLPPQAFWVQKITFHLLKADFSRIPDDDLRAKITERFFEVLLATIGDSLRTCVLDSLLDLLRKAFLLVQDLGGAGRRERFLRLCWNCYSVIGDQDILGLILLVERGDSAPVAKERAADELIQLFLDALPQPAGQRKHLGADVFRVAEAEPRFARALSGYARAQAAWLALSFPRAEFTNNVPLLKMASEADRSLQPLLTEFARQCTSQRKGSPETTELLGLSAALWAYSLGPPIRPRLPERPPGAGTNPLEEDFSNHRNLDTILSAAEDAVLLASELLPVKGPAPAGRTDFLVQALAFELCGVSVSAILTAYHAIAQVFGGNDTWQLDPDVIRKMNDVIGLCGQVVGGDLPAVTGMADLHHRDLHEKTDAILRTTAILWSRFGLQHLADQINIRRLQYRSVCLDAQPDEVFARESWLESVGTAIHSASRLGVLANLAIANSVGSASELMAHFCFQAAMAGHRAEFGPALMDAMSIMAIRRCSRLPYDLAPFLAHLLRTNGAGNTALAEYLGTIPESELEFRALDLLYAAKGVGDRAIREAVHATLKNLADALSGQRKHNVDALVHLFQLEDGLRAGKPVDLGAVRIAFGAPLPEWIYAWALHLLLAGGKGGDAALREAEQILQRDAQKDPVNSFFYLALSVAERLNPAAHADAPLPGAVLYIRTGIHKWESSLPAESNLEAYGILHEFTGRSEDGYEAKLEHWSRIKMYRDQLRLIPELAVHGDYFLIFQEYCKSLRAWGLALDVPWSELSSSLRLDKQHLVESALRWRDGPRMIPEPMPGRDSSRVVSGEFLFLGFLFLSDPVRGDPRFDGARAEINKMAQRSLPDLFDSILKLERLPLGVKRLVGDFMNRFEEFSVPAD
jgi:hypothetical protein